MKTIFAIILLAITGSVFAHETESCTLEQINMLREAEGRSTARVNSFLDLESPDFECSVTPETFAFIQVCGTFTYVKYNFVVLNAGKKLKAVVHHGGISCTGMKQTKLIRARFSR
jgi:hypothetical protein